MLKKLIYISAIILLAVSCNDFLYQEPDLQISINEQLSTREGVLQAYNGIYYDTEDIFSSKFAVYADALGGNITFTPSTLGDAIVTIPDEVFFAYNFNANPQELNFDEYYDEWYAVINQVNLILSRIGNYTFFSTSELNQLQAELLTIRALAHYQVSLLFSQHNGFTPDGSHLGVVYNTAVLTAGVDFPSRKTMAETYIFIKADLDSALNLYSNTPLQSGPGYSYFNTISTTALYARIALQMDDWQVARDLSSTVINNSGISLTSQNNYIVEWEAPELPVNEVILEFSASRNPEGNVSSTLAANFQFSSLSNYADYVASGDLLALYEVSDIRQNLFLEVTISTQINGVDTNVDYHFTKKFQDNAGTLFMRLSELYLIRAEANARLGSDTEALSDLNTIRTRANLAPLNSTSTLLNDIFVERRRELAFEGHLLFDIVRYKKDVERNLGCIAALCNLSYPSNFFILPIPEDNVLQNENIQQNEGY
ncbi:MAG: RagB/SusD family nutrient uptake outer membrane protein [Flavobacteriaceae bacterium]|nr:RagB/SusD family nutrient uptake outer membrane protein [Flavobacteriaceae bacterium]